MTYTVVLERDEDGGYSVYVPALRGCNTEGDSVTEAVEMAKEAILAYMDGETALGRTMPPDVEEFTLEVADLAEALVLKVTVPIEQEAEVA
jgi:predicted RNase H-like HicB family nuclease